MTAERNWLAYYLYLGNTERVTWGSTALVELTSPSPQDCVNVISQLATDIQHDRIYLHSSSPESTVLLLSQIHQTKIRKLEIVDTLLNEQHMYLIIQCLLNNQLKGLYLNNTKLTSSNLSSLTDAVSINTSLEILQIEREEITKDDVSHISKLLTVHKTLKRLDLFGCGISDSGVQCLSSSLLHNYTLFELNLRGNQFTSTGIQYLIHLLTTNNTIRQILLDCKYKSSSEQLEEYTKIRHRLFFS